MAEDTYLSVWKLTDSVSMRNRVTACAAKEGVTDGASQPAINVDQWVWDNRWEWASAPGWGAAFEYAELSGNEDPGADPAVITDAMILSQVQAMTAEEVTP